MPALAVAKCLRERGVEVRWMGTARGLESQVAAAAGFEMETIHILGLRGKGPVRQLILPLRPLGGLPAGRMDRASAKPGCPAGHGGVCLGSGRAGGGVPAQAAGAA